MNICADETISRFQKYAVREKLFQIALQNDNRRWKAIRDIYKTIDTGAYSAYPVDWTLLFSPIESAAWGAIRYLGLPFWPQFPIDRFFADFADPNKKIVIECDGKDFHDPLRDEKRDSEMNALGWTVFRISGADCKRIIEDPWEEFSILKYEGQRSAAENLVFEWATKTVDGLVWAIGVQFYGIGCSEYLKSVARRVIGMRTGVCYA